MERRGTDPMKAIASYKKLLVLSGFYPNDGVDRFYYLRFAINWFMSLLIFIPMVVEISLNLSNFALVSNTMYYSMTQASYLCKLINFILNRKNLRILESILMCDSFNEHTKNEDHLIKDVITKTRIMSAAFRSIIVALLVLYLLFPHLEAEDSLALPGWYPLNVTRYRDAIITTQVMSIAVSAHNNSTLDLLNCTLIMLGAAQFEILQEKLKNVYEFEEPVLDGVKKRMVLERIRRCVKQHQKILEYVVVLDQTFSNGLFIQFIGTVVVICLTGFQMITVQPSSIQFFTLLTYFLCMLFQVSMYCYIGNHIMLKSSLVGEACYMSNWYKCEKRVGRIQFIIMERAKRPVVLTGGKFFNLTLATLVLLLRSSYSYFAVLQRIYDKENEE